MNTEHKLESKVQYKNFEKGEFTAIQTRTLDETKKLISQFPWNEQSHLTPVGLTGPSITVQGVDGFLKIGHYYNNKYCCYFLSTRGRLYYKIAPRLNNVFELLEAFFSDELPLDGFLRKGIYQAQKHFYTDEFVYRVTPSVVFKYCLGDLLSAIFFTSFLILSIHAASITFAVVTLFFTGYSLGGNLLIFHSFYKNCSNKIIKISKGHDSFYYGDEYSPERYSKKDITLIKCVSTKGSRNPYSGKGWEEIHFINGFVIQIPNLLISSVKLARKFDNKIRYKRIEVFFPILQKPVPM